MCIPNSRFNTTFTRWEKVYDEHMKKLKEIESNNIIIDEWDINSNHSLYRKELAKIYASHMTKNFNDVIKMRCEGCQLELENQLGHDLCIMSDMKEQVDACFNTLFKKVDNYKANEQCFELLKDRFSIATTDKQLYLNTSQLMNDNDWIDHVNKLLIKQLNM